MLLHEKKDLERWRMEEIRLVGHESMSSVFSLEFGGVCRFVHSHALEKVYADSMESIYPGPCPPSLVIRVQLLDGTMNILTRTASETLDSYPQSSSVNYVSIIYPLQIADLYVKLF